jgi:hypothetical protein
VPDAERNRHAVLRPRRDARHEGGREETDDPAHVAKIRSDAMMTGERDAVSGVAQHRKAAEPGSGRDE